MARVRTLFCGSAEFALPTLKMLLASDEVEVVGVLTQPDRPVGRHQALTPTVVKQHLLDAGFAGQIFTPEKLRLDADQIMADTQAELVITAAYGQIIPKVMLEYPRLKAWNLHGSLLPLLRGAVPVHMAILQGFEVTGVTLQTMSEGLDEGEILAKIEHKLNGDETSGALMSQLAEKAAVLLWGNLSKIIAQDYDLLPQKSVDATYCYQRDIGKDKAEITQSATTVQVERMVRAFQPWPVAWLTIPSGPHVGKRLKIYSAELANSAESSPGGEFGLFSSSGKLFLQLSDGEVELKDVQLEGKDRRAGTEYLYLV